MNRLKISIVLVILVNVLTSSYAETNGVSSESSTDELSEEEAYEKILELESYLKSTIESLIKRTLPTIYRIGSEAELSAECLGSLIKLVVAIRDMKLWAFEMLDATGKLPSGILKGILGSLGNHQQCLQIRIPDEGSQYQNTNQNLKTGQYCVVTLRPYLPRQPDKLKLFEPVFKAINATFKTQLMNRFSGLLFPMYILPIKLGICLPSTCSIEDMGKIMSLAEKQLQVRFEIESCELPEKLKLDQLQFYIISTMLAIVLICVIATVVVEIQDYRHGSDARERKSCIYQVTQSFSIVSNFKLLMSTKKAKPESLDCVNGLRYLSTCAIVLLHSYGFSDPYLQRNMFNFESMMKDAFGIVVFATVISVESFFFITATLISYNVVQTFDKTGFYKPIVRLLRRAYRLLVPMLAAIALLFLLPLLASGPEFQQVKFLTDACEANWWKNSLFVGNFGIPNKMCLPTTWYVGVDMQMLIFGLVYFALLFRKNTYGRFFLGFLIIGCLLSNGIVTYIFNYPPGLSIYYADLKFIYDYFNNVYMQPSVHLGPYAVGLYLGTYLAKHPRVKHSKLTLVCGWVTAIGVGTTVACYPWNTGIPFTTAEAIIFSATQRTIWSLCLAWIVYICFIGQGGYVNSVLSWPGFQPLINISYLIYLIHFHVYFAFRLSRQGPVDFSHSTMIFDFFATLCISHILAVILRIFIESPATQLENMLYKWLQDRKSEGKTIPSKSVCVEQRVDFDNIQPQNGKYQIRM